MCGIAGLVDLKGREVRKETIKTMTDAIKHRGPDGEGQWVHENVGIGHRRLSIIDLSDAAAQPMFSPDSRYALTYNGEIYNYKEIRLELEALGNQFRTASDSEVLLVALIQWKAKALIKFNGMFAFAFYDTLTGEILFARDRYGIKPLYYSLQDSYFTFGSEQKAIKALHTYSSDFDKEAFIEYLTFQNIFTNSTFEKEIKILQPGHFMKFNTKKYSTPVENQYWDFHFNETEFEATDEDYQEELDRLFVKAVERTLISDVEVGSYLSGGMDSGSITAVASRQINNLNTFTVGFDLSAASGIELGYDERAKAAVMAREFKTIHHEYLLSSDDMEKSLRDLVWHLEEPRVGQSYPNFYAAKLARSKVKVVLSGAGGDELFGGYPWRYYIGSSSANFNDYIDSYYTYWQRLLDNQTLKKLTNPIAHETKSVWTRDIFETVFLTHKNRLQRPEDYVNHSMYFEAKTFLQGLLIVEDKLSMAHGLETRLPFLDNDLVNFALSLPVRMRLKNLTNQVRIDENTSSGKKEAFFAQTSDGKLLLRKTMARYLNPAVTSRAKQGFSSPDSSWFKDDQSGFVKRTLLSKSNPLFELVDKNIVRELLAEHQNGYRNRRLLIWSLLYMTIYLEGTTK
jgi:asparagine synthase (glutamine-hydrolysing)